MSKVVYFNNGTKIKVSDDIARLILNGMKDSIKEGKNLDMSFISQSGYFLNNGKLEEQKTPISFFKLSEIIAVY
jgi:hypothetical protein